jgi:deoxyribonuclease-4
VGVDRIKVLHINDTKEKLNSCHDRHCDIGDGFIGRRGFYFILNHPSLKDAAFILETPKDCDADDLRNLETTRKIYSSLEYGDTEEEE